MYLLKIFLNFLIFYLIFISSLVKADENSITKNFIIQLLVLTPKYEKRQELQKVLEQFDKEVAL